MNKPDRLILLPGLAADERMYRQLAELNIQLLTPRLLIPERNETMAGYSLRHAQWLKIGANDVVGGCSFGSMVASEICRQRSTRGLILLSGALSSAALAPAAQKLKFASAFIPYAIARQIIMSSMFLRAVFGAHDTEKIKLARQMISDTPREILVRGSQLAARYTQEMVQAPLKCPVFALHGGQDRVLAVPAVKQCHIIADAGHGMVISHPEQVDAFLQRVLEQLTKN